MPPIEAMVMQVPVLTTECASIKEVTGGLLNYVKDPMDPKEWADRLEEKCCGRRDGYGRAVPPV